MKDETIKVLWIATLVALVECFAICMMMNGYALALAIGGLCGLGGYSLKGLIDALRGGKDEPDRRS